MTKCLASLQPGDVLIGCPLDCLGRSLHDLRALLDDLKAREVAFRSLMEMEYMLIRTDLSGRGLLTVVL